VSRHARARIVARIARTLGAGGLTAALAAAIMPGPAPAAPLKLPEGTYKYTVIDQDIVAALQAFGSNLSLKVNISPDVNGRIQGKWPEVSPRVFLDWLGGQGNFDWYYDGQVLHFSAAKEAQTRFFVLPPITVGQFKTALDAFGVSDDRYGVQSAPGDALVKVAGPPRFVALAEQTLAGLIAEDKTRPRPGRPRVAAPILPRDVQLIVYRGAQTNFLRIDPPATTDTSAETNPNGDANGNPTVSTRP
jgi:type II secretory pathway component GspD/PulD (secretin)